MRATKHALIVTATAAAVGVAAATASADTGTGSGTEPLSVALAPHVDYTASVDGNAAVITVDDAGRLVVDNGRFEIRSADGQILAGVPLEFNVDDIAFPIDAEIAGNTARLVPVLDPARAQYKPAALPFQEYAPWKTPYEREQAAFARLAATVTMGVGVGGVVGAAGAGVVGCLLGGLSGTALTGPLATLLGAGPLAGCLIGAGAFAPIGAVAGALFVGAPVAVAAFIQYFSTINEPLPAR